MIIFINIDKIIFINTTVINRRICYIEFGDLTPYLAYRWQHILYVGLCYCFHALSYSLFAMFRETLPPHWHVNYDALFLLFF
jgi:hypothetical protein